METIEQAGNGQAATEAQQASQPEGVKPLADGRVQILSPSAYKRMKDDFRTKGERNAMNAFEEKAKAAGFTSVDAMFQHVARLNQGAAQPEGNGQQQRQTRQTRQPQKQSQSNGNARREHEDDAEERTARSSDAQDRPRPPSNRQDRRAVERYEHKLKQWDREREQLQRKFRLEERKRRELQRSIDEKDAEMALREAAISAGVKDVDFAVYALKRELQGKEVDEVKAFDERAYFESLRSSHPYLFGETVRHATTGVGPANPPAALKPSQVTQSAAELGKFDAMDAKQEDVSARLKKFGITGM